MQATARLRGCRGVRRAAPLAAACEMVATTKPRLGTGWLVGGGGLPGGRLRPRRAPLRASLGKITPRRLCGARAMPQGPKATMEQTFSCCRARRRWRGSHLGQTCSRAEVVEVWLQGMMARTLGCPGCWRRTRSATSGVLCRSIRRQMMRAHRQAAGAFTSIKVCLCLVWRYSAGA